MKKCNKCSETKSLNEFHKNSAKPDGVQSACKRCRKKENAVYYTNTVEQHYESRTRFRKKTLNSNRELVMGYLLTHPCVDCGTDDWRVLQFDHVGDNKLFNIAEQMQSASSEKMLAEIAKCEVRCANCHQIVTSERLGGWRTLGNTGP